MTNPNLINTSQTYMRSNIQLPISTSATDILETPAASNMIIRADTITICNTTASSISIDVYLTRSSVTYAITKTVTVPAYSSLVVIDRDYPVYLKEGDKLQVQASDWGLQAICAYTIISDTGITLPSRPDINEEPLLIFDTFTDTNNTVIASHTPDTQAVSGTYRTVQTFGSSTNIQIISNRAQGTSNSTTTAVAVIETGQSDVILTCDVNKNSTGSVNGGTGVAFRVSGSTGYYVDYFADNSQSGRQILRFVEFNGTSTAGRVDVDFTHSISQTYTIKVVLKGSSIKTYVDDILYHDITNSTYTGTEHGISVLTNSTPKSWADNLSISPN